jgi:gas vesicle protein
MRDYEYEADGPFVVIEKETGSAASFLWGVAIGAGLALLFAPRTGEETRRAITTGARRVQRNARERAEELGDTVVDRYEQARRSVENRIDSARQAIELKRRQATRAMQAGRQAAHEARQELERRIAETKAAYQAGADVARSAYLTRPEGDLGDDAAEETGGTAGELGRATGA